MLGDRASGSPTWDCTVGHPVTAKWLLLQSQTTQSQPISNSVSPRRITPAKLKLGAGSHPLCRTKFNRAEPLGLGRTDHKSTLLGTVPLSLQEGAKHFILIPANSFWGNTLQMLEQHTLPIAELSLAAQGHWDLGEPIQTVSHGGIACKLAFLLPLPRIVQADSRAKPSFGDTLKIPALLGTLIPLAGLNSAGWGPRVAGQSR